MISIPYILYFCFLIVIHINYGRYFDSDLECTNDDIKIKVAFESCANNVPVIATRIGGFQRLSIMMLMESFLKRIIKMH